MTLLKNLVFTKSVPLKEHGDPSVCSRANNPPGHGVRQSDICLFAFLAEKKGKKDGKLVSENQGHEPSFLPGDAILGHLQNSLPKKSIMGSTGAAAHIIQTAAREIARKILAMNPENQGNPEVRFILGEPVLQGTEVRISNNGSLLWVRLIPPDEVSRRLLLKNLNVLKGRLKRQSGNDVSVEIV